MSARWLGLIGLRSGPPELPLSAHESVQTQADQRSTRGPDESGRLATPPHGRGGPLASAVRARGPDRNREGPLTCTRSSSSRTLKPRLGAGAAQNSPRSKAKLCLCISEAVDRIPVRSTRPGLPTKCGIVTGAAAWWRILKLVAKCWCLNRS